MGSQQLGFLTNRKAEESNWTPVSISLSSALRHFNLERIAPALDKRSFILKVVDVISVFVFLLHLLLQFYLFAKEAGYGLSDVDAISRHSVSVVAQLPTIISSHSSARCKRAVLGRSPFFYQLQQTIMTIYHFCRPLSYTKSPMKIHLGPDFEE